MPKQAGKKKQHSTEEANFSRLVTKIRWIIESVTVEFKKWKYFNKPECTIHRKKLQKYCILFYF